MRGERLRGYRRALRDVAATLNELPDDVYIDDVRDAVDALDPRQPARHAARYDPTIAPVKTGPKFYWAKTEMTDNIVTVWHPEVKNPKKVQYNWSHYPLGYLANEAGLPASCFELKLER